MTAEIQKGLEGVVVAESDLTFIDGQAGRLAYRGYAIEDLAREASFEEVVYLLWNGSLPTRDELDDFTDTLADDRAVDDGVIETLRRLAEADEQPMGAIRTAVSMLSAYDDEPDADPDDLEATRRKGRRITAKMPTLLAAFERLRNGHEPVAPHASLGHAANFLYMLDGEEPEDLAAETFDVALTLHADHGFNASTFTTLVIAATLADTYSAVTGGIGALSGPLHGGANKDVMRLLTEIDERGGDAIAVIEDRLESGGRVPGFGHRVYKTRDPRAPILEEKTRALVESTGESKWYDYAKAVDDYLSEETDLGRKGIATNVDFYSGTVYDQLGLELDLFPPIFAVSRVSGWVAHIVEYQRDNRLIRPLAQYTGPEVREFVPIEDR